MKPGDILFFKRESGMSKIIRWFTKSLYSHVAICVSSDMNLVIEATAGLVRAADIRTLVGPYDVYRANESYDRDKVISFLVSKLNLKYDYAGVVYLGLLKLLRLKRKANTFQRDKDWFCSELVAEAFEAGGLILVPGAASILSPKDISESPKVDLVARG